MKWFLLAFLLVAQTARADFFANAQRTDMPARGPVADAMATLTFMGRSCSAFFVANSANKLYMASARHCANFTFHRACQLGILTIKTHVAGDVGTCARILATDLDHDEVIFEATFAKPPREISALTLSTRQPEGPLEMYGYPNDRARRGTATVTSHCWANNGIDSATKLGDSAPATGDQWVLDNTARVRAHEHMIGHNCDVYGGNSGGPIVLAGTTKVIGLPGTYFANRYEILPSTYSAYLYALDSFIAAHRDLLTRAGITIDDK